MSRVVRANKVRIRATRTRMAVAKSAALAAATGCSALVVASPANAAVLNKHLAVDCPQPYSQTCATRQGMSVTSTGPIIVKFTADGNPPSCAPGLAQIYIDNQLANRTTLQPGGTLERDWGTAAGGPSVFPGTAPRTYDVEIQVDGVRGGCNTGSISGWSGNLQVETDGDARRDLPAGPPGVFQPKFVPGH